MFRTLIALVALCCPSAIFASSINPQSGNVARQLSVNHEYLSDVLIFPTIDRELKALGASSLIDHFENPNAVSAVLAKTFSERSELATHFGKEISISLAFDRPTVDWKRLTRDLIPRGRLPARVTPYSVPAPIPIFGLVSAIFLLFLCQLKTKIKPVLFMYIRPQNLRPRTRFDINPLRQDSDFHPVFRESPSL